MGKELRSGVRMESVGVRTAHSVRGIATLAGSASPAKDAAFGWNALDG